MRLLGSTKYNGKEMTITDSRKFLTHKDLGIDTNYYGGNIKRIGVTRNKGVYLLLDEFSKVFDILIKEEELKKVEFIGDLDKMGQEFIDDVEAVKDQLDKPNAETDLFQLTNKELKAILEEKNIEFDDKAIKKDLVALIEGE